MANVSVLGKTPAAQGGAPRSGFSLDQAFTFTMTSGHLLPAYKAFINVGEHISGCPSFFMRTDPLLAPVMGDVDVFVDCFFVPMTHLCAPFDQWLFQINDNKSDYLNPDLWLDRLPVINSGVQPFFWVDQMFNDKTYSAPFEPFGFGLHRLLTMLHYNPQSIFCNLQTPTLQNVNSDSILGDYLFSQMNNKSPNFCPYYFAAYQKIYFDYYRDTDFENNEVKAYNFDYAFDRQDGNLPVGPQVGATDRAKMFMLRYRNRKKDYFTAVHPSPLFNTIGMLPNAAEHLSQMNNWLTSQIPIVDNDGKTVSVPQSLAGSFRISSVGAVSGFTSTDEDRWHDLQSSSFSHDENVKTAGYRNNLGTPNISILHDHTFTGSALITAPGEIQSGSSSFLQLSALRSAFAYDKLLRLTSRAGKHVDDQVLAHFGYKVPQGLSGEVYHLKSYHSVVHFGEVTATASTEVTDAGGTKKYTDVGEMSGKGYALLNSNDRFSFTAPDFGIFMAIISCAPRYRYLGAVEKDGFKVYLPDFFKPSLDHLGQQPLFRYEYGLPDGLVSDRGAWQYRWMEDKIKFDVAAPVFATVGKNAWTFAYQPRFFDPEGDRLNWMSSIKVRPTDFNKVMVNQYNPDVPYPVDDPTSPDNYVNFAKHYLNDPFTIDFSMDFKRVSEMSTFGEPSLGGID